MPSYTYKEGSLNLPALYKLPKEVNSEVILLPNEAKFYAITKWGKTQKNLVFLNSDGLLSEFCHLWWSFHPAAALWMIFIPHSCPNFSEKGLEY